MNAPTKAFVAPTDAQHPKDSTARAKFTCFTCYAPIEGARVQKVRSGSHFHFHPECWTNFEAEQRESRDRHLRSAQESIRDSFGYCAERPGLAQRVGGLPVFPFADLANAEFRRRASRKILGALERYKFDVRLMISGPTGCGKTSGIVARLNKSRDDAVVAAKPSTGPGGSPPVFRPRFFFLSGYELVSARRNWKLGEESPVITLAKDVELLILDELGFEPLSELPFEVLDHRYRSQRVSIVTTGLKPAEFRTRYGDAAYRRIAEGGAVIEDW